MSAADLLNADDVLRPDISPAKSWIKELSMGAIMTKSEDPRDNLLKMHRDELYDLGTAHGIVFPQGRDTPAFDATNNPNHMVPMLRAAGIRGPDMSHRVLGSPMPLVIPPPATYSNKILPKTPPPVPQQQRPLDWNRDAEPPPPIEKMTMGQMRKECKSRGIKMDRRDNMNTLRDKLREHA
jgi:hypothetical protein